MPKSKRTRGGVLGPRSAAEQPEEATVEAATPSTPSPRQYKGRRGRRASSKENMEENTTLPTPTRTPFWYASRCFHTGAPKALHCRGKQISQISDFIHTHVSGNTPGLMYISGTPGTGKTASLENVLRGESVPQDRLIHINCMGLSPHSLYRAIGNQLGVRGAKTSQDIQKILTTTKEVILLVLEEVDQVTQGALDTVYQWPLLPDSKLVLIGVANTLDVPCLPPTTQKLQFQPYSRAEIEQILNQRLREQGVAPGQLIHPTAIKLVAGKVAALKGDIRNALDQCRRAMEMTNGLVLATDVLAPRQSKFNIQLKHKLIICAMVVLGRESTMCQLFEQYRLLSHKKKIDCLNEAQMLHAVELLEAMGILQQVATRQKTAPRFRKVCLKITEEEVATELSSILA